MVEGGEGVLLVRAGMEQDEADVGEREQAGEQEEIAGKAEEVTASLGELLLVSDCGHGWTPWRMVFAAVGGGGEGTVYPARVRTERP